MVGARLSILTFFGGWLGRSGFRGRLGIFGFASSGLGGRVVNIGDHSGRVKFLVSKFNPSRQLQVSNREAILGGGELGAVHDDFLWSSEGFALTSISSRTRIRA